MTHSIAPVPEDFLNSRASGSAAGGLSRPPSSSGGAPSSIGCKLFIDAFAMLLEPVARHGSPFASVPSSEK